MRKKPYSFRPETWVGCWVVVVVVVVVLLLFVVMIDTIISVLLLVFLLVFLLSYPNLYPHITYHYQACFSHRCLWATVLRRSQWEEQAMPPKSISKMCRRGLGNGRTISISPSNGISTSTSSSISKVFII